MIVESISILVILFLMLVIFLREHRYEYARTSGILMILPGSYLVSYFIGFAVYRLLGTAPRANILLIGIIIGLIAACMLVGLMVYHIRKPKLKLAYACTNGLFLLILGILMLFDTLQRSLSF